MNDPVYPVHLHRRFEQRWAARFAIASVAKPTKPRHHVEKLSRRRIMIEEHTIEKKRADHA